MKKYLLTLDIHALNILEFLCDLFRNGRHVNLEGLFNHGALKSLQPFLVSHSSHGQHLLKLGCKSTPTLLLRRLMLLVEPISHLLFIIIIIISLSLKCLYRLFDPLWLFHHLDFLKPFVLFKHTSALESLIIALRGATSINQTQNACADTGLQCLEAQTNLLFYDFLLNAVLFV